MFEISEHSGKRPCTFEYISFVENESQASERLMKVVNYLRIKHFYCFWCGTQYKDKNEMDQQCPGAEEEVHN
jgi:rubrerythrin